MLCLWMTLIFCFSSQNADESSETSGSLIAAVAEIFYPSFEELTDEEQAQVIESFQFIARKTAHFSIYGVLGLLSYLTFVSYRRLRLAFRVSLSGAVCLLYAVSDEIHQMFVPGRSCEVRDVCIDFCGSMLAIGAALLISRCIRGIYKHIRTVSEDGR
ncbi:MAG: VanZ family protein [Acutalibacteraceae bacterium]